MQEVDFDKIPEARNLQPLPLTETALDVVVTFRDNFPYLVRLAMVPALVMFLLMGAIHAFRLAEGLMFFAVGVNLYLMVWYAVAVQRLLLLGPGPDTLLLVPRWGPTQLRFFLRALGILAIMTGAMLPAMLLFGSLAGALAGGQAQVGLWMIGPALVGMVVGLLLIFSLPAAALGPGYGYPRAFRESRDVILGLLGLFLLIVLPADLLVGLGRLLVLQFQFATDLVVPSVAVSIAAAYLQTAIAMVTIAVAFARRVAWQRPASGEDGE